ncbi:hypothetical protein KTC92_02550 [Clostridium sp. CM027]|uniref:hypothetical protein n=1 Tax=Clostridium sp. CM027 TaxID=2849865 RepID=UPI001C6E2975|nr:hypothetical protein [Clostridium sp. CM027]MBW9145756.1 hypothetical protein [Clostridium sp. CM027]UVE41397.1 hypothetical protein KTC92_02550 [Clostridium sp. CM027]
MSKYKEMNKFIKDISKMICENQTICKLLYYNTPDALDMPDIEDAALLINKNILFCNSVPGDDEAISILSIVMTNIENDGKNPYIRGYKIVFTILVHSSLYVLDEGDLRVVGIMSELDDMFNAIHNSSSPDKMKRLRDEGAQHTWASKNYNGYSLIYSTFNRT